MERSFTGPAGPEPRLKSDAAARARRVKLILMDVDGVLTDGRIVFTGTEEESKFFDAQDGVGVRLAQRAGLKVGLITGRKSPGLERRAAELGITELHMNALRKAVAYAKILGNHGLTDPDVAFVGDDLVDMPIMKRAGLAATVPNARPEVIQAAHFVTGRAGGRGAAREILDFIMKVQGTWRHATHDYL